MKKMVASVLLGFLLVTSIALAASRKPLIFDFYASQVFGMGAADSFSTTDWIFAVILPFVGLTAFFYGLILRIGFFKGVTAEGEIAMLIALVMAYSLFPTGFMQIILDMWGLAGMFAAGVFGVALGFGSLYLWYRARAVVAEEKAVIDTMRGVRSNLASLERERAMLLHEMSNPNIKPTRVTQIQNRLGKIDESLATLRASERRVREWE